MTSPTTLLTSAVLSVLMASVSGIEQRWSSAPPKAALRQYAYKTKWFKQRVDHFSFANGDMFEQRYLVNDTWWDPHKDGPIFFYTGNEGDIEAFAQNSGFMWDIAPEFKALLVFAEHRYYGKTMPYGKKSTTNDPKYVGYLTSEQALADFAALVRHLKSSLPKAEASPVIAFGGSYGGMLAAWFRIKFPHVCDGAIAASAPVAQFSAPCDAFGRVVTSDYKAQGSECSDTIRRSWAAVDNLTASDSGLDWLSKEFRLCKQIKKVEAVQLKSYLNEVWTNVAMMDYPYPTEFLMPLPGNPVKAVCKAIIGSDGGSALKGSPKATLRKVFAGLSVYFNHTGESKCLDYKNTDEIGADMWDYQACTEMVMPFCFDGVKDMFEASAWNYTQFARDCHKKWNTMPRPDMADLMYGERRLQGASNIVFTNGLLDPWSSGGILRTINKSVVSLIIPEGAHHLDLRAADPKDPPSVTKARDIERQYIKKWIEEAGDSNSTLRFRPGSPDSIYLGRNSFYS